MRLSDLISMTLRNLLRRKTRTLLTTTGVIVGTCAIVVMISMGIGMTNALEASLSSMGDLTQITIENYGNASENAPKVNDDLVAQLKEIPGVVAVSPFWDPPDMSMYMVAGRKDRYQMYMQVKGVYPDALEAFGYTVSEGQLLESSSGKKINIMFGNQSAYNFEDTKRSWRNNRVYPEPQADGSMADPFVNPMKDKMTLELRSREYDEDGKPKYKPLTYEVNVTGVLSDDTSKGYETIYYAFMDIADIKKIYKEYKKTNKIRDEKKNIGFNGNDPDVSTEVKIKVADIDTVSSVDQIVKDMGLQTYSLDSIREPMQKQMQQQQLFLGSLAAISLLVAAIGITNTMIMSIYERTREIGVMKVLGCKLSNIRVVFLFEAGLIGCFGGIFGVGISMGISKLLNSISMNGMGGGTEEGGSFLSGLFGGMGGMAMGSELSVIPMWLILSAIAFATVIGLVSGFYPANRAVKISALEAIKHE